MQPLIRRRLAAAALAAAAAALTGCAASIAGEGHVGPAAPTASTSTSGGPTTRPLTALSIDVTSGVGHVNARDVLITSPAERAAFLQLFGAQPELQQTLAGYIDAAPDGAFVVAGAIDTACQPSTHAQVWVREGRLVLKSTGDSDHARECYVPYTSYAVAALDRESVPSGVLVD